MKVWILVVENGSMPCEDVNGKPHALVDVFLNASDWQAAWDRYKAFYSDPFFSVHGGLYEVMGS